MTRLILMQALPKRAMADVLLHIHTCEEFCHGQAQVVAAARWQEGTGEVQHCIVYYGDCLTASLLEGAASILAQSCVAAWKCDRLPPYTACGGSDPDIRHCTLASTVKRKYREHPGHILQTLRTLYAPSLYSSCSILLGTCSADSALASSMPSKTPSPRPATQRGCRCLLTYMAHISAHTHVQSSLPEYASAPACACPDIFRVIATAL